MTPAMMGFLVLWGLVATTAMAAVMQLAQGFGLSRMSLTFMVGSAFSGRRDVATVLGFALYVLGGGAFEVLYFAVLGFFHGLFLLACVMPLLPFVHPRMASEHHGATALRQLEPPGFLATNYGYQTPAAALGAQMVYGAVLGACLQIQQVMGG